MAKEIVKQAAPAIPEKVQEAIKNIRICAPHVKYAWIDADGAYHFHKRPGFTKYYVPATEEEVDDEPAVNEPVAPESAGKPNDNLEF